MQNTGSSGSPLSVGAVILAAGGSTRLGSPKQLLGYRGRSLLWHAAETVLGTSCRPVVVVLGAGAEPLREELAGLDVTVVYNPDWGNGMGTSIRRGIETLETLASDVDGVVLTLCDQPLVRSEMLESLVRAFRESRGGWAGVAAEYGGTLGVPALFGRGMFAGLRVLPDDAGAKALLRQPGVEIGEVSMPEAAVDIDTREQYEAVRTSN